jgi:hypothetical protein
MPWPCRGREEVGFGAFAISAKSDPVRRAANRASEFGVLATCNALPQVDGDDQAIIHDYQIHGVFQCDL